MIKHKNAVVLISVTSRIIISKASLLAREVWGSIPGSVQSETVATARHLCDVSSELYCPGDKPRRWTPPLLTRFGVIPGIMKVWF